MAQNTTILVPKWTWTLLTDSDVSEATFVNNGGSTVLLQATVGETPPTTLLGAIPYPPGYGASSAQSLADLFPGVSSATRLYAYGRDDASSVTVSHA